MDSVVLGEQKPNLSLTLTPIERSAVDVNRRDGETAEDVIHRLLEPLVADTGEQQLQVLANHYRTLSPTDKHYLVNAALLLTSDPASVFVELPPSKG